LICNELTVMCKSVILCVLASLAAWVAPAQAETERPARQPAPDGARLAGEGKPPPFDNARAQAAAQVKDPEAATRAYLQAVSAERRARTKSYAMGNYFLAVVNYCVTALILLAVLATGFSARLRGWVERISRFRALQTALYGVLLILLLTVLLFPLTWYQSYHRETLYGLLNQSLAEWLADQGKGLAVLLVIGSLLLVALYAVLRRAPRTWWLWGWGVVMAFLIVGLAMGPVFLAPLFNKFTPVSDAALRQKLLTLAHEQGIPADDVYEMDASRETDRIGAYVAGMLGTTRIVLFDTMLKRCTPQQIEMIMSHEMGHYVLNHVWKSVGVLGIIALGGFLFVRWAFARISTRWPAAGIKGIDDVAGLPLIMLLLLTYFFFATPLINAWSRTIEWQADDFGLNVSQQPDAAATAFLMLGEYRDLDPHPLVEKIFFDHPSGKNRIHNAMEWKKAHRGDG
jgi:STE24 endopeptidase